MIYRDKEFAEIYRAMRPAEQHRHQIQSITSTLLKQGVDGVIILRTITPLIEKWRMLKLRGKLTAGCSDKAVRDLCIEALPLLVDIHNDLGEARYHEALKAGEVAEKLVSLAKIDPRFMAPI